MLAAAAGLSSSSWNLCRQSGSELLGQHPVDACRGQRRCRLLQLREGGTVRSGDLLGQRRLEDGQRLTHLHGAALELTEHLEQMLGRTLLNLSGYDLAGHPGYPLPEPELGPSGEAQGQRREPGGTANSLAGDVGHAIN